jgi:hypothetical protein
VVAKLLRTPPTWARRRSTATHATVTPARSSPARSSRGGLRATSR